MTLYLTDHHVYVWLHSRETPVVILKGHSHPVNCVDWNTANPTMLASGSDDGTVRIWGTEGQMRAEQQYQRERARLREQVQQVSIVISRYQEIQISILSGFCARIRPPAGLLSCISCLCVPGRGAHGDPTL